MGTIVGIEAESGTVLAGDRRVTSGTTVRSDNERKVFDFASAGAAVTGDPGGIDEFGRRLESEIQGYRTERGERMGIQRLSRVSATVADTAGVEAIVSTYDEALVARIREVGSDERVLDEDVLAVGSGMQIALGRLEGAVLDVDLDAAASLAHDVLATVAEHDAATGPDVDVWRLEHSNDDT